MNRKVNLSKTSGFTALHSHEGELKEEIHKHDFKYEINLKGEINKEGFLIDFLVLNKILKDNVDDVLNQKILNTIIEMPTTENLAIWIWETLKPTFKDLLCYVRVFETHDAFITYCGE